MPVLYPRKRYLDRLMEFSRATDLIKVLTGVRRCGKSSLMYMVAETLLREGVCPKNLIFIDLSDGKYSKAHTMDDFWDIVEKESEGLSGTKYLFVDEIQRIEKFEDAIEAVRLRGEYSIYLTGSNSYLLSGDLATVLTGRYIEYEIQTLAFDEYLGMKRFYGREVSSNLLEEFESYLLEGGFPRTVDTKTDEERMRYVRNVLREIEIKDIKRNRKIRDRELFGEVMDFCISNFGSPISVKSLIGAAGKKRKIKPTEKTVYGYLEILVSAKILYECPRLDIRSKSSLFTQSKYYLSDLSFYRVHAVDARRKKGSELENVVYSYAKYMDYDVAVGRGKDFEVDFVLRDLKGNYSYVQVADNVYEEKTMEREFGALKAINDNWPKYLLTLQGLTSDEGGYKHRSLAQFMAKGALFD